ncbi:MAG: branched-chain amino acid ABC transporter permease [Christensenellales bacterium]
MNTLIKGNTLHRKVLLIIGLLLLIVGPIGLDIYYQQIMVLVLFFAFCATAWNVVCGFVGQLSLGHATFLGLGAYISTLLLRDMGLSPWIGMFIGAGITALVGVLVGYPCFRLKGPYFALTTIALGEVMRIWVENNEIIFGIDVKGSMGLLLDQTGNQAVAFEFGSKLEYYYVILAFLLIALLITYLIKRSKLGFYLTAIKSDPDAAESLGIPLAKYKLIAMALSCFLIAFAGTFYAQYYRYVGPNRIFGHDLSVQIALIALVGGQGTVLGPLIGAVLLIPLTELLSEYGGALPGLHLFIYGVVMVLVVFYMPKGIHGLLSKYLKKIENKLFFKKKPIQETKK